MNNYLYICNIILNFMGNYKEFEESVLVDFGNYLLSKDRDNTIQNEQLKDKVTDADLKNWENQK